MRQYSITNKDMKLITEALEEYTVELTRLRQRPYVSTYMKGHYEEKLGQVVNLQARLEAEMEEE